MHAITVIENGTSLDLTNLFEITAGKLTYIGGGSYGPFAYEWTFSATGYEDVIVTLDLSSSGEAVITTNNGLSSNN